MKNSRLGIFQMVSSSLWITVLVVRVGCIIEAHPSPSNSNRVGDSHKFSNFEGAEYEDNIYQTELETAASHSILTSPRNALFPGSGNSAGRVSDSYSKKDSSTHSFHGVGGTDGKAVSISTSTTKKNSVLITVETTPFPISSSSSVSSLSQARSKAAKPPATSYVVSSSKKEGNDDDRSNNRIRENLEETDGCSRKPDGYYQHLGSGCTSYYFCAAGYQITYVCPVGSKFNGERCETEYNCPTTTRDGHPIKNECEKKSNGYYSSRNGVGKYFYCFQQAKVIELQCDPGKIFVKDKCVLASEAEADARRAVPEELNRDTVDYADTFCTRKSNGFYQDLTSNCEKYYYCIGGEKTELRCQDGKLFNGDICVHSSRYECPIELVTSQKLEQTNDEHDVVAPISRNKVFLPEGPLNIPREREQTLGGWQEGGLALANPIQRMIIIPMEEKAPVSPFNDDVI